MKTYEDQWKNAKELADSAREGGRRVVFTNGCFDLLHVGHVRYLQSAAELGAALIVGVNSDQSVRRLGKGEQRPYNTEDDRREMLSALECVSTAILFDEDTPLRLIKYIRPDILAKGGDYSATCEDPSASSYIVGSQEVRAWGGEVHSIAFVDGCSTTKLIESIRANVE